MGQGDLCGFLTGGVLALGLLFGRTKGEERVKRGKCRSMTSEYYNWWKGNFSLHCSDIRKLGVKGGCKTVGRKASSCLEGLIEKELKGNFSTEEPPTLPVGSSFKINLGKGLFFKRKELR